jgi:hypothetical protein
MGSEEDLCPLSCGSPVEVPSVWDVLLIVFVYLERSDRGGSRRGILEWPAPVRG